MNAAKLTRLASPSARSPFRRSAFGLATLFAIAAGFPLHAQAQVKAPSYEEFRLDAIFPAGGRQGKSVVVDLFGSGNCNLSGAKAVLVDGLPGITVNDVQNVSPQLVRATFKIAENALPGRRCVRVLSERSGLTNMIYFTVGRLPELTENETNDDPAAAPAIQLPVVVNGRINPEADIDCFRFELRQGQHLTAAVLAHQIDSHGQGRDYGYVDPRLELLDERGRVVAEADDTLGLDPIIDYVAPAAGAYTARVTLQSFNGFPQAVYRLAIGELAMPLGLFPPGGRRGEIVETEWIGANLPDGRGQKISADADGLPWRGVVAEGDNTAELELPFVIGNLPEVLQREPNEAAAEAMPLEWPLTVNARIDAPDDADWFRVRLAEKESIVLETTAQRYLRSPVDTLVELYDGEGKKLAENDDGFPLDYVSMHDYRVSDSRLSFTAPAAGDYLIRVSDQSGGGGKRAVYRLSVKRQEPDFELYLYPDGVPVWGPGATAALLVKVVRFDQMDGDIAISLDGLPPGWTSSQAVSRSRGSTPPQDPLPYVFLTLTAPAHAQPGDLAPLRVVGRAEVNGRTLERTARPLTWYYTSDTGFFRLTPTARAAVTLPQGPSLRAVSGEFSAKVGQTVNIPVEIAGPADATQIDLTADMAGPGVATALCAPQTVPIRNGQAELPLKLPDHLRPGRYGVTVSLRWRSDIRIGMPGPCTQLIQLQVVP
ncbi:MAG TPA: PPC domain-containing protein [Pirellulales bacterium]|nr:PPC domain-containing protein [Pirellulales bacterium]